jgi:hypothetical protein
MTAVVVGGALANKPASGGEAWVRLSWIRGLQQLGLDVWFVEELDASLPADLEAPPVATFRSVTEQFGLAGRAALIVGGEVLIGPSLDELVSLAPSTTLVNVSGHVTHPLLFAAFRRRVLVDIDPGFTQLWHATGQAGARVAGHDVHFTIGEHIGSARCPIPTGGIRWLPVRQPVVLRDWPCVGSPGANGPRMRFTTVGNWRGPFGPIELDGRRYGLKVHEFRRFIDLPARSTHRFELALRIDASDDTDIAALRAHGWQLTDPDAASAGPDAFRAYVQRSDAEFSVAQGIYVDTHSGWFSDRTVRYLASGKPALVQDTGFSDLLPTGQGLIAFRTIDEAVAGADDVGARYDEHAAAARALAERHFDSDHVLARFCEQAGIEP